MQRLVALPLDNERNLEATFRGAGNLWRLLIEDVEICRITLGVFGQSAVGRDRKQPAIPCNINWYHWKKDGGKELSVQECGFANVHRNGTTIAATLLFSLIVGSCSSVQHGRPAPDTDRADRNSDVACTMEAKICPDGTAVQRAGPSCEFADCPGESHP